VLGAKLRGLEEQLLHHWVVLAVPVDACLSHQHRDVLFKFVVVLLQAGLYHLVVSRQPCVLCTEELRHHKKILQAAAYLNLLGEFAELFDILCRELIEFPVSFLGCSGNHDAGVQIIIQLLSITS
jgi:hypothetical protein